MNQTNNDIPASTREAVIKILNARLADSFDLMHHARRCTGTSKERASSRCTSSSMK